MSTIHVRPGEGRHYPMIDGDHIAKVAVHDAGGAFEVFEVVAPAKPMSPPHVSPWTGVLFLLEGGITALVDGTSYAVEPGGLIPIPEHWSLQDQRSREPPDNHALRRGHRIARAASESACVDIRDCVG
jgi:hypothetical protein